MGLIEIKFIIFTKMIRVGRKEISQINVGEKPIAKIYTFVGDELKLIWEAIRSCFGSG